MSVKNSYWLMGFIITLLGYNIEMEVFKACWFAFSTISMGGPSENSLPLECLWRAFHSLQ